MPLFSTCDPTISRPVINFQKKHYLKMLNTWNLSVLSQQGHGSLKSLKGGNLARNITP